MTLDEVIHSLKALVDIHHELIDVSNQKTEEIKVGNVERLQDKVLQERRLVLKLEQAERKRQQVVERWFSAQNITEEEKTISTMLTMLSEEEEQSELASVTTDLTEAITTLKRTEQLNRELLEQSMQFVQMSLSLLSPSLEQMNYGGDAKESHREHSVFDSKA